MTTSSLMVRAWQGVFLPIGEQQAHLDFTQRHSLPQAGHHGAAQAAVLGGRLAEADIDAAKRPPS